MDDGSIVRINDGFTRYTGFNRTEAIGKSTLEINIWKDRADRMKLVSKLNQTGFCENLEAVIVRKDGSHFTSLVSAQLIMFNEVPHIVSVVRDITERKRVEAILRVSEEKYRILFQNSPDAYLIIVDGVFVDCNKATENMLRGDRTLIVGKTPDALSPEFQPDGRLSKEAARERITQAFNCGLKTFEWVHRRFDGTDLLVEVSIVTMQLEGQTALFTTWRDISLHKQAEEALKQSSTRLTLATRAGGVGVWDWDLVNNILLWDDQMFAQYGVDKDTFSGTFDAWKSGLLPDEQETATSEIQKAINGEKEFNTEFRVVWPDGSIHNIKALAVVQRDDSGKPLRMVGTNWDITEQKNTESVLLNARQEAEIANRAKSSFLANMSHEIRTPLNAIIGFSHLMNRDKALSDAQQEYNTSIIRAGEHLLSLINDILELSKVEAGRVMLHPGNVDLQALLQEIQLLFKERARSKHLKFHIETAGNLPRYVIADESKVRQILINLIGNAIKFTEEGGVSVNTRVENRTEGISHLIVEIKDSGPGIPEHEQKNLFKHFVQTSSGVNQGSGTGLGLALSRELAILMGGDITLASTVGKGSVFTFHLEIKAGVINAHDPNRAKRVVCIDKGDKPYRILVADDKKENLNVVINLLKLVGFETIDALNGKDAIEKSEQWNPDLILMDLRMPVMDGFEATRRIKLSEKGSAIPIIALTANMFEGDREKIESMNIQGYISKPFSENELLGTIGNILGITYIYEEESDLLDGRSPNDDEEIAKEVSELSESLRMKMLDALAVADIKQLKKIINGIEEDYPDLARFLMKLARNYDYSHLQKILNNLPDA
jgi:PAS domain S-box-containing protein